MSASPSTAEVPFKHDDSGKGCVQSANAHEMYANEARGTFFMRFHDFTFQKAFMIIIIPYIKAQEPLTSQASNFRYF